MELPIYRKSDIGRATINIDEINLRQDQILVQLDELDQKINDIIEVWTRNEAADTELENAA